MEHTEEMEFKNVPQDRFCIAVMGHNGDSKFIWDPSSDAETTEAKKLFKSYKDRGYLAFRVVGKAGAQGDQMTSFEETAGRVIFVPPMSGG